MNTSILNDPVARISASLEHTADLERRRLPGRFYLLAGVAIVALLCGGLGVWSATARISGAVIAAGTVVVDNYPKLIQHPTGGPLAAVLVRDGDRVLAGDVVLRLDATTARANLQIISTQIDEVTAMVTRLQAEMQDRKFLSVSDFLGQKDDEKTKQVVNEQIALFRSRLAGQLASQQQCSARIQQARAEVSGFEGQRVAKVRELELTRRELDGLEKLEAQSLVGMTKITSARRTVAQLEGSLAQMRSMNEQAKGKILEHEAMLARVDHDFRTGAGKELSEQQARLSELNERRVAAEDQVFRSEIRAPVTGFVNQLAVHSTGAVVSPGQQLMTIVPVADSLVVESKVAPEDIDQIVVGGAAEVRFTAFNRQTTPSYSAVVTRVSADVVTRESAQLATTGASPVSPHYLARLEIVSAASGKEPPKLLVAGMPAEVFFKTNERTPLSYLLKPIGDQFDRAFRQE